MKIADMFVKRAVLIMTGVFLAMALSDASAANKWYTARTINGRTQPISAGTQTITMPDGRTMGVNSATVSGGLIDIVISLYNNPTGDDNGNTQDVDANSVAQDNYEKIIQYFADGVYEATESTHSIRNVRIYRGGLRQDADVTWQAAGHPSAWYLNQQGISATINMYDKFNAHVFTNAAEHEGGGYCLSHEFGHYFYGMLDEYCRWNGGWVNLAANEKTQPCIMNSQWNAVGRTYTWLNHSIMYNTNSVVYADYECRNRTAQYQFFGDGAWRVLSRNPNTDPLDTAVRQDLRNNRGTRMYYPELAAVAPVGTAAPRIDLSSATPLADLASRQHLNILWMGSNIVVEIIIDKSGSMYGTPLANAKTAAKFLVDQVPDNSAVGVVSFDDVITTVYGITIVTNAARRTAIKSAIDGITDGNLTDIGDAAMSGLNQILAFGHTNFTRVAFLLSDGDQTVDTPPAVSPLEAAASYQSAQIPIMAFGYGYVSSTLLSMAALTGGSYYDSPTTLSSIAAAFQDAFAAVSARQNLADGTFLASGISATGDKAATVAVNIPFQVDATIADISVSVGYNTTNTVALNLTDPNGTTHPAASTNLSGSEYLLSYSVSSPTVGAWKIGGTASSGSSLRYQINAGVTGFSYYLSSVASTSAVVYPDPIQIVARLTRGPSINGAAVRAIITDEDNNTTTLPLANTDNGTYTATFLPTNDSIYSIVVSASNSANAATYTYADMLPSADDNGEIGPIAADTPVNEAFTRTASFQVTASGSYYADVPYTVSGLSASTGSYLDYVKLSWSANYDASYYEVWRADNSASSADAVKIADVAKTFNTYIDTAVSVRSYYMYRYYYWVKAVNFKGASGFGSSKDGWPLFGPAIRVNDASAMTLGAGNLVDVSVLLQTGEYAGYPCDWWVVAYAETLGAIFYVDGNGNWQQAYGGFADVRPIYQGGIFDIDDPYTVLSWDGLPAGIWNFYFGLDTTMNGYLDPDVTIYDKAVLHIQ